MKEDPELTEKTLNPITKWVFPVGEKQSDINAYFAALAQAEGGFYPLGVNRFWHGGIHIDSGVLNALGLSGDVHPIACMAEGEVVAYRVNQNYPKVSYDELERCAFYSTGFALVRHRLVMPKIVEENAENKTEDKTEKDKISEEKNSVVEVNAGTQAEIKNTAQSKSETELTTGIKNTTENSAKVTAETEDSLILYSLYMHQMCLADYDKLGDKHARPAYWDKQEASYSVLNGGANVRPQGDTKKPHFAYLQAGATLTFCPEKSSQKWAKIKKITDAIAQISELADDIRNIEENGWISLSRLKIDNAANNHPRQTDEIVILDEPVPIKAGDLIGYMGHITLRSRVNP